MFEDAQSRRKKRCFHRVISGLEKGGSLRLITLTSSNEAVNPIQQDFRRLMMRLQRRKLVTGYLKVIETKDDWREHIHLCFRGSYIAKAYLSYLWNLLHQSPIVDIRAIKQGKGHKRRVANYLAKYMVKEFVRRYSWSWAWVYKGFVKVWKQAVTIFMRLKALYHSKADFGAFLKLWGLHLHTASPPDEFLGFLKGMLFFKMLKALGHPAASPLLQTRLPR